MYKLPQMVNIADLRNNHLQVLVKLDKGPVVINSRSQPVGVLVHPQAWDNLIELLEDQQLMIDMLKMEAAMAKGEVEMVGQTELKEWLQEDELVPA
jgi:prevent-host-death family protein